MYNDFVIVGPKEDPAKIRATRSAMEAFKAIEQAKANFISRGDNSGTHVREKSLWKCAGIKPKSAFWYFEAGQGMAATLEIANERGAYTIADRGTYLTSGERISLPILSEGDRALLNIYTAMEVNPANSPRINAAAGKAFADFMVAPQTQNVIGSFGVEKFGRPLFFPRESILPLKSKLKTDRWKRVCPNQCLVGYLENQRRLSATEYGRLPEGARAEIDKEASASPFYCLYCDCVWIERDSGESYSLGRLVAGHRWHSRQFS